MITTFIKVKYYCKVKKLNTYSLIPFINLPKLDKPISEDFQIKINKNILTKRNHLKVWNKINLENIPYHKIN